MVPAITVRETPIAATIAEPARARVEDATATSGAPPVVADRIGGPPRAAASAAAGAEPVATIARRVLATVAATTTEGAAAIAGVPSVAPVRVSAGAMAS